MALIDELWIGDDILLVKSGRAGKFNGVDNSGKVKVKLNSGKIIATSPINVIRHNPATNDEPLDLWDDEQKTKSFQTKLKSPKEIDLHIAVLAPHLMNEPNFRILEAQVNAFLSFIDAACDAKHFTVTVIHGKGEGVLRTEIQHRLKQDNRVKIIQEINNGGATEVWLQ